MSVSATGFEITFLRGLWIGSAVLSVMAMIVMVVLILRRVRLEQTATRRADKRQALSRLLYAALKSPVALDASVLPALDDDDRRALVILSLDMLRSLRDAGRIVDTLALWGMIDHICGLAARGAKGRRIQALTLIGHFDDDQSLGVLLTQMREDDMDIQITALRSLAQRGAADYLDEIVAVLSHARQTNTLLLSDILHRFGPVAVPHVLRLSAEGDQHEVRIAALMALGAIGAHEAALGIVPLLEDAHAEIRAEAAEALGRIADPATAPALARRLDDDSPAVRAQALLALGAMHIAAFIPQVAARLADADWWVRFRAAQALHRFGDRGVAALRALRTQPGLAGDMASQVLLELGDGR